MTLPGHSRSTIAWSASGSSAASVVAIFSMLNRGEQRARAEGRRRQRGIDRVVIEIGGVRAQPHLDPEDDGKDMVEPQPRGRAAERPIVRGEQPPRGAAVGLRVTKPQRLQRDALRIEHPYHIVVGPQDQAGRVLERRVGGEPFGIGMAVRRQDRQRLDPGEQRARHGARRGIGREKAVGMELKSRHRLQRIFPLSFPRKRESRAASHHWIPVHTLTLRTRGHDNYRITRAPLPFITASTSLALTMEVSPGVVMASAPCAAPYSTAACGPLPSRKP